MEVSLNFCHGVIPAKMASALMSATRGRFTMLSRVCLQRALKWSNNHSCLCLVPVYNKQPQCTNSSSANQSLEREFDEKMLQLLVCPLSKKDLRYDRVKNELVCDAVGVAYPIINGIPNLVPQDARMLKTEPKDSIKS